MHKRKLYTPDCVPTPNFTSRYLRANATHNPTITTKHNTLPSGPTLPPLSQSGPANEGRIKCPGSIVPLSGTEYRYV